MAPHITQSKNSESSSPSLKPNLFKRFLKALGPGVITGASDDDPSGIGTYASAGALIGFSCLWTTLFTFPLMTAVQFICAKIGMVSGMGLAETLKRYYSPKILYPVIFALLVANTINIGADIGAIAAGINLLIPIPVKFLIVPLAIIIIVAQIFLSYKTISKIFLALTFSLFGYIAAAMLAKPNWSEVLHGTFVPTAKFDEKYISMLVAILGTTISPYLFFWQADMAVEEDICKGKTTIEERQGSTDHELKYAAIDVHTGMFFSNAIMFFIITATAATLHATGKTDINTAADAAVALKPFAGAAAEVLMALGLIGTGFLAVPVLASSAAYAVSQAMGWPCGLSKKPKEAKAFYIIIALATVSGLSINYVGISALDALVWTAVINGFIAPPLLVVIMLVANNREIMGDRVNSRLLNILGWLTVVVMSAAAIALVTAWRS